MWNLYQLNISPLFLKFIQ